MKIAAHAVVAVVFVCVEPAFLLILALHQVLANLEY
jgi:hypothetical protein